MCPCIMIGQDHQKQHWRNWGTVNFASNFSYSELVGKSELYRALLYQYSEYTDGVQLHTAMYMVPMLKCLSLPCLEGHFPPLSCYALSD